MDMLPGMTVLRIVMTVFFLPLVCGSFFAVRIKTCGGRGLFLHAYVYGWIAVVALFEAVCVPYVAALGKFSSFCTVYTVSVLALAVCSAAAALAVWKKNKGKTDAGGKKGIAGWAKALWVLVILSVAAQMVFLFFYNHMDGDDSYYVAQSVIIDFFDTMFQRDSYTGLPYGLDVRHALAAQPVFVTWLSRMCGLHAATTAHAVLGPVFLGTMYGVHTMIGRALFSEKRDYVPVFLLILQVWYLWGNVSIFTPETFLYTRTWQGKAVFSNIIVPLVFYLLYQLMEEWRGIYVVLLILVSVAGIFTTTAAVFLLAALFGITLLYCLAAKKERKKCLRLLWCFLPEIVYGGVYLCLLKIW